MNKPLSIALAIVALVLSATMPLRGQSALSRFDPNANRGAGNGSERIAESVPKALIGGPATPTATTTPTATPTPVSTPTVTPTPTATPTPSPTPGAQAVNLSTRMHVQTGDNAGIGGFIITGNAPKHVLLRAIGPSITGLPGVVADPVLELHGSVGFATVINNNWQDDPAQAALIQASGLAPTNTLESAIDATLNPGAYTGVVRGNGGTNGIGLVEVYDLSQAVPSKLANISTRALVGTGNDIVIAGFILGNNSGTTRIVLRGLGGSLTLFGIPNALANPNLELRDNNAALLFSNDNWQDDPAQAAELTAAGLAPTNASESGIAITLGPGQYSALLSGVNNTTGVGVVEFYDGGGSGGPVPTPTPTPTPPGATPSPTPPGGTPSPTPPGGTPSPTTTPGGTPSPTPTPPPPVITSPLAATVTVGQLFVYQFEATGATSLGVSNPPPGLTFNSSLHSIVGNPTAPGTFSTGLSAMNAGGTTTATLTITVQPPPSPGPAIMSSTAAGGRTDRPFSFRVMTTGGSPAVRLTANGLPPGLAADPVTGRITGIPTSDGSFPVTITVTDGNLTTTSTLQLTFTSNPALPVIVSPNSASLIPGQFFTYTIVTDAPGPTSFAFLGTLPSGLTFDATTGTISGTYSPPRKRASGGPPEPEIAGGNILGNLQLFSTNLQGNFSYQFSFHDTPLGVVNIATRAMAGTGNDVLIGAFVIDGNAPKVILVRAIGPSLTNFGVPNALADPTLRLQNNASPNQFHDNDNWGDDPEQKKFIEDTGLKPSNPSESAIIIALDPGSYSAIVSGKNSTTGTAVVDVFDLGAASLNNPPPQAKLANISTRAFVGAGDNVLFGGFSVQDPGPSVHVVVRAIGPSLEPFGILNFLTDPTLELRGPAGFTTLFNNDWMDWTGDPIPIGLRPSDPRESAMAVTLGPGQYTAIVRGNPDTTTGVAAVHVFVLE